MVVRVEPFDHLQRGNIDTTLLVSTAHGEVFIDAVEVRATVTLGNSLEESLSVLGVKKLFEGCEVIQLTPKSWM